MNNPNRRKEPYHIIAEIHDPGNIDVARMVGRDEVELLLVGDLVARIIAQTCLQSGLAAVYMELLNFHGHEIYMHAEPRLIGTTFKDAVLNYEDSTVIGISPKNADPVINPPMDMKFSDGDSVIAISLDDDTIIHTGIDPANYLSSMANEVAQVPVKHKKVLILGWNWRAPIVIGELQNYFVPGSSVNVVADIPSDVLNEIRELPELKNETVTIERGSTTDRNILESLGLGDYDKVIIMCYSDTMDVQEADACTLVTLLHLREIARSGGHNFTIVTEMLDIRNRKLAESRRSDDFVVSETFISLLLTQISENKDLGKIFDNLFSVEGSEVYLRPVASYVKTGEAVNFYTVARVASEHDEVAIGYRRFRDIHDSSKVYGIVMNPKKLAKIVFEDGDKVIVLSEV